MKNTTTHPQDSQDAVDLTIFLWHFVAYIISILLFAAAWNIPSNAYGSINSYILVNRGMMIIGLCTVSIAQLDFLDRLVKNRRPNHFRKSNSDGLSFWLGGITLLAIGIYFLKRSSENTQYIQQILNLITFERFFSAWFFTMIILTIYFSNRILKKYPRNA